MNLKYWKYALFPVLFILQSCFQENHIGSYSLYHVRFYSVVNESTEKYIKENANIILRISSLELDSEFERLDSLSPQRKHMDEIEASSLLVRHADGEKFRLGLNSKCSYLIIFHDNKAVCDETLYTDIFEEFQYPLGSR